MACRSPRPRPRPEPDPNPESDPDSDPDPEPAPAPAQVLGIDPPYGSLLADVAFVRALRGTNFAPTGTLACRYGFGTDSALDVPAEFVDTGTILCAQPAFSQPLDVPVLASIDGARCCMDGYAHLEPSISRRMS